MLVDNITQTITEIPMAGKRGVDVQTIFVNKQEAFQDALTEVFVGQINTLRTQLNTFIEQLNTTATQFNTDATTATTAAEIATAKNDEIKNVSVGSTITAVPSTPASVTYSPLTGKFTFVIPRGEAFQVDARGAITDRSLYDTMYQGFGFLALDESKIYFKNSSTSGDWSVGLSFGKGEDGISVVSTVFTSTTDPSGLAGQSGATDTYTINYSNLETDTFIVKNGEDGLDNITDTVIGTETTWSSTKIKNLLAQKADKVEVDQSIDSLGSTTVKLTDNQTIDGVKTFSSNIVGNITGNASYATSAGSATNATNASSVTNGVYTTGNQTIAGVKTFSSSPIVPTPTTGTQAVNKDYVDSKAEVAFVPNDAKVKTALNASGDAPIYACRAWVNFNGQRTVAIRASGNVSSITDNGTGSYTANIITPLPLANISATTMSSVNYSGNFANARNSNADILSIDTTTIKIATVLNNSDRTDQAGICISVFG